MVRTFWKTRAQQNQTPLAAIFSCSSAKSNRDLDSGIEMADEGSVVYARATN
jgi:hypothetical protein